MIGEVSSAPPVGLRRAATVRVKALASYDLLLAALLGFMTAARLWLVPGYLRGDTWLALTAGREVWTSGIPHHETLTSLAGGERWVDQQWFAHLATYALERSGGLALVAVVSVVLAAGSFAAMTVAARGMGARARAVLAVMPATAFPFFAQAWQPRTQMFAYPLFAAVFLLLAHDARRPSRRVLWALPLVLLWANVHGSVTLGAALVCLRGLLMLWQRQAPRRAALLVASPLLLLATPYGAGTAHYYRATLLDPAFKRLATEWQPITHDPLLLAPFAVLVLLTAWTLLRARDRTTLWERIALVVLLVAAATALRNMVWLTLGAVPILALALDSVVPREPVPTSFAMRTNRALAISAAAAVALSLAVTAARPAQRFERDEPGGYLAAVWRAAVRDRTARIVADVGDADWFLWRHPSLRGRIAFDARLELLSASGVRDIASLLRGSHDTPLRAGEYRIFALDRGAATPTISALERQPGARVVFSGSDRVVIRLAG